MNGEPEETTPQYVIVESDRYQADRDAFVFQMTSVVGPVQATRWAERLKLTIMTLPDFPARSPTLVTRKPRRYISVRFAACSTTAQAAAARNIPSECYSL